MEKWMKRLDLAMDLKTLGVTEDMLNGIVESTLIMDGGYKILTKEEVLHILKASM
jgi:hypothetical protein